MSKLYIGILLFFSLSVQAQMPTGYYDSALGKTESGLKTQLFNIISAGTSDVGYGGLYNIYETSDITVDGKVWDMYSTCSWTHGEKKCGNYSIVCDCYNREHTIPQSWFSEKAPMVSDAYHVYPTDGKVNGQRSNFPYGESSNGSTLNNGKGRLGSSTFSGYSGTVFEPDNEFKGDLARTYFYFATRYQDIMTTIGGDSFNKTFYPSISSWSVDLFLKWHRQDPVSQKETIRNNAIAIFQHNRNPFIDYPELAEYIWGTKKGTPWSLSTEIEEFKIEFSIYPNPAQQFITIKCNNNDIIYTIYNLNGQIMLENPLESTKTINVAQLENGMYLLQLSSGTKKSIQKIIINK